MGNVRVLITESSNAYNTHHPFMHFCVDDWIMQYLQYFGQLWTMNIEIL